MSPIPEKPEIRSALRAVAVMEAIKGLIVFGAGFGLLALLHHDVRGVAESLVTMLHIDPERHYAGVFLDAASKVTDARLWGFAALALAYSVLRLTEAYGLWFSRRWAAWLGAASGGIYVPVEIYELAQRPTAIKAATLVFNVALVAYLIWTLQRDRTQPTLVHGTPRRDRVRADQPTATSSERGSSSPSSSPRKPPL